MSTRDKLTIEDRIVLSRFLVGVIYGVVVYILALILKPLEASRYAWAFSIIVYYFTILYVAGKYHPTSRFQLYLRGLATFYGTWILTAIILYELLAQIGVKP